MDNTNLNRECAEYFKSNKGFKRLFEGIKEKYRSLGYIGGTVQLVNLSPIEKDALSGILRRDYYSKKSATIKIESIIEALESTRFQGVDFKLVIMEYFKEDIISKREEKSIYNDTREKYFNNIISVYENTMGGNWLRYVLDSRVNPFKTLMQKYDYDREELRTSLEFLLNAINSLTFNPGTPIRLALFSSTISRNLIHLT